MDLTILMICLLIFMIIQAIGTYFQVKLYKKAVKRLHKKGNIGIGGRKSRFSGNIVIIACDSSGQITDGEILAGFTIFNKFKKIPAVMGKSIFEIRDEYESLSQKQKKKMQGHIQAVGALCDRLQGIDEAAWEQEKCAGGDLPAKLAERPDPERLMFAESAVNGKEKMRLTAERR